MDAFFDAKIVSVRPCTVHEGKALTQDVDIELGDGVRLQLFDYSLLCSEADVGKTTSISVSIVPDSGASIEAAESGEEGISLRGSDGHSEKYAVIGSIERRSGTEGALIVRAGQARFLLQQGKALGFGVSVGVNIKVHRFDLEKLVRKKQT